jgi:hypothetical protein
MPEPILTTITAALVAGATAQASNVASQAVADAYSALKTLVIHKLGGKTGAVQSVEDEPETEEVQANLVRTLANNGLQADAELKELAERLESAVAEAKAAGVKGAGDVDVKDVRGKVNATVERLAAAGSIRLGEIVAETGDATLRDLTAGGAKPIPAGSRKKKR